MASRSKTKTMPPSEIATGAITRKKPYPFQKEIVEKGVKELSVEIRTTIVMPCGSGKTLVALWIAERMRAKSVIVFAPTLGLLAQTAREFLSNTRYRNVACLAICSDSSVAEGLDEIRPTPDEVPFAVTGEVGSVYSFLENNVPVKFLFCTYQSADVLGLALTHSKKTLDLAIFDEAHRTAGKFEAPFTIGLLDENLPVRKRLFMTATLRVYFSSDTSRAYSMDNFSDYGRICAQMSFASAVKMEIICPYQVVLSVVNTASLPLETIDAGVVIEEDIDAREAAIRESLIQTIKKYNIRKIITYHSTIERAGRFISIVLKNYLSDYEKLHVNSLMPGKARNEAMERFRNSERAIISNARCLTEGIDVPAADLVVFADPKHSWIDIVQAIGRVMRVSLGKKTGYVFLPLFLDQNMGESIDEALDRSNYEPVWQVLQALCAADQEMEWTATVTERGLWESTRLQPIVEIQTQPGVDAEVIRKSVGHFLVSNLTDTWDEYYDELLRFKQKYGNTNVPFDSNDYSQLRNWLNTQISRWNLLSPRRKKLLIDIGFDPSYLLKRWWKKLEQASDFKENNGNLNIPNNTALAKWITKQRKNWDILSIEQREALLKIGFELLPLDARWQAKFKQVSDFNKEKGCLNGLSISLQSWISYQRTQWRFLPQEKRDALLEIGFDFRKRDNSWQKKLDDLRYFTEKHGHCNVRKNENKSLWKYLLRLKKSMREGQLSEDKIMELEKMNIVWEHPYERAFNETYRQLVAFRERYGRFPATNIPAIVDKDIRQIAVRMITLRTAYRKGILPEKLIERLREIGFSFNPTDDQWQARYKELKSYVDKGNDPNSIPWSHSLQSWIRSNRKTYRDKTLAIERIKLLEKLGLRWENKGLMYFKIKNDMWENNFQVVKEFFKENERAGYSGGNSLPTSHPLYDWWQNQLTRFYDFPPERAEKMRSLKPVKLIGLWSKKEKEIVLTNPEKSAEELAELLIGRTAEAVQKFRDKYGIQ